VKIPVVMAESPWVKSVTPDGGGTSRPSKAKRVEMLSREEGPVVLYQFSRAEVIRESDRRVEL
jgi:hypothetical protein